MSDCYEYYGPLSADQLRERTELIRHLYLPLGQDPERDEEIRRAWGQS